MKFTFTKRAFLLFFITVVGVATIKGQTTLVAGDIAFTGYNATPNSPQSDAFSFVLLRSLASGTIIRFTDNAFGNNNTFRIGEQTLSLTFSAALSAGEEITISGVPAATTITATVSRTSTSAGTATGNMLSMSLNGDQVIAYQSATASVAPFTFISAIHMNVYNGNGTPALPDPSVTDATNWDNLAPATQTANSSYIPTGLTTATNAIWIGTQGATTSERNNARFSCTLAASGGANLTTVTGVRMACNNKSFWNAEFAASGATTTWPLPSGCNFLGIIVPIKLISFKAQNILADAQLNWSATEQTDFSHFELERSFDGTDFKYLAKVSALPGAGTIDYAYTDKAALKINVGTIYYRLKMVDVDGSITYSGIVKLSNSKQKDFEITNFQNPLIGNKINFLLLIKANQKAAFSITDLYGRQIYKKQQNCTAGRNQIAFPDNLMLASGVYFLNIQLHNEAMQSIKFVKN